MKLVFFKKPEIRRFDYKPRYYDVEKEERAQRRKELGLDDDDGKTIMKGDLQARWRRDHTRGKTENKGMRSTMYLVLLVFFVYVIFFTDFVQNLVSSLLK